ncbi:MAG TPA: bifunctional glycoside hydrolase 114/ polysaccharide deacetylase family protein [Rhodocyclaceae bacterium]|nr:bifunctional glycoside hydrolase 114/ polysaccharide deacetylase family protein [Rhodocyclaceae bacterium]
MNWCARVLCVGLILFAASVGAAQAAWHSIAFHYGANAPLDELHAFDIAVVDPDHGFDPSAYRTPGNELFAYVSVGEVNPSRPYASQILPAWRLATNQAWGSIVIDQRPAAWREFFYAKAISPLWARGYRGFFLDTLDSYQLGGNQADPIAQQAGLVALIKGLRQRFPGIRLIANRGFELMPGLSGDIEAVAAESLFRGWDAASRSYRAVPEQDRAWLLEKLGEVKRRYGIPVIAIDYVSPDDRALARETAQKIRELDIVPWVADGGLGTLGVSNVEVLPRRVLIVFDSRESTGMHSRSPHRYVEMLLNYFGYVADYADANRPLPEPDRGSYAGLIAWFDGQLPPAAGARYARWLGARVAEGWRVALFDDPGFAPTPENLSPLGLSSAQSPVGPIAITQRTVNVGYELEPMPRTRTVTRLRLDNSAGTSWLRLHDARGEVFDGVGMTRWGGFVWNPFSVVEYNGTSRWVVNPWEFLRQALALPDLPVPDTTSDAGRRMLFAHMDGDGFPSRAEFAGSPYCSQVVFDQILKRYPTVPHTMSVIEGEVSPQGLYPKDSPALEAIARQMFALPNVEIASHTFSHPFRWSKVEARDASSDEDADYHLDIPNYIPSLDREIEGSVDYIRTRLAPADKQVRILLWSGDAAPTAGALAHVRRAGLLNMNGGNTTVMQANPSITHISPLGARLGSNFQVFAPIANENVYTNLWRGPFYGFEHVTETFSLTGEPRRIKPIDIYFHTFSASKPASLKALQKAYDWALSRPVRPVFSSEFMQIADAFNHVVLARDAADGSVRVRNAGALRSLRAPRSLGEPNLAASEGLAGWSDGPDGRYLIMTAEEARLRFGASTLQRPYLVDANARVMRWQWQGNTVQGELAGHAPVEFTLANAQGCAVRVNRQAVTGSPSGQLLRFKLNDAAATLDISCRGR